MATSADGSADRYPNLRRVITGHDEAGQSVVMVDGPCHYLGAGTEGWRFQDIWSHRMLPAPIDATEADPTTSPLDMGIVEHGLFVRISDVPPTKPGENPTCTEPTASIICTCSKARSRCC